MKGHWLPDNLILIKISFSLDIYRIIVCWILSYKQKIGNLVNLAKKKSKIIVYWAKNLFFMNLSDRTIWNHMRSGI